MNIVLFANRFAVGWLRFKELQARPGLLFPRQSVQRDGPIKLLDRQQASKGCAANDGECGLQLRECTQDWTDYEDDERAASSSSAGGGVGSVGSSGRSGGSGSAGDGGGGGGGGSSGAGSDGEGGEGVVGRRGCACTLDGVSNGVQTHRRGCAHDSWGRYVPQAVQCRPSGGQFDFVRPPARAPHGAYVWRA